MNTRYPIFLALGLFTVSAGAGSPTTIFQATLAEDNQSTAEVSTAELQRILTENSATVIDARPYQEYAISHIPGVMHVEGKPGATSERYVSDADAIAGIVAENKNAPIVLYCSGPFCGRSKRTAKDLVDAGYDDIRRYQLGMPVWRALGGVSEIELEGIQYVHDKDQTAVFLDTREASEFQVGTLPGAHNLTYDGVTAGDELDQARKDGRLPVEDHNTRIVVFGHDGAQARAVAETLTRKAFHNVAYFPGTFEALQAALK